MHVPGVHEVADSSSSGLAPVAAVNGFPHSLPSALEAITGGGGVERPIGLPVVGVAGSDDLASADLRLAAANPSSGGLIHAVHDPGVDGLADPLPSGLELVAVAPGLADSVPRGLGRPCFLNDPQGEVEYYFQGLANTGGRAALDTRYWENMPMYCQYIEQKSLREIVRDSVTHLRSIQKQRLTVEDAARLPRSLGFTTTLPCAVACEFFHRGCGFPAVFVFDLIQACLASCQHKDVTIALYADQSKSFTCKARWWACPTGDPNAGKSPACAAISKVFTALVSQHRPLFYPVDHFVGVGNNGKIQERLRKLEGVLLLWGPEAKPILDPNFPIR